MVFQVVLKLKVDDEKSEGVSSVLAAITRLDGKRTLGGGGGYLHGRPMPDDDFLVVLCIQKNDAATGDIVPVTEADREQARAALASHPNVARFLVGPVEPEGRTLDEMDGSEAALVREFRHGHHP
jgi:hypothetical protein